MRRWGLTVWLFRVVLPAIVAYWSGRSTHALRRWIGGGAHAAARDDLRAVLLRILSQSLLASTLLILMIAVEVYRLLLSIR
jgi:hypothetical protein